MANTARFLNAPIQNYTSRGTRRRSSLSFYSALLTASLLCFAAHNNAVASQTGSDPLQGLSLVGEGKLRWMAWHLYDAKLYSAGSDYDPQSYPVALAIEYARPIDKKHLLSATVKAWSKLGINAPPAWAERLSQIWPSVNQGDALVFRVSPSGTGRYYYNGELIGKIDDPAFGTAFLAIWLHPETSHKSLRSKLLGG